MNILIANQGKGSGFTFAEILVSATVAFICLTSIMLFISASRVKVSKSLEYLRAAEIAHETVDWINSLRIDEKSLALFSNLNGPLPIANSPMEDTGNSNEIPAYGHQYEKPQFFRKVIVETPLNKTSGPGLLLKKITVEISWQENGKITESTVEKDHQKKKYSLSALLFLERRLMQ